ncbi:MAG TPA: substrate-binding domain-containing protein, partial [Candidatus Dormibacteraeota bacterium]
MHFSKERNTRLLIGPVLAILFLGIALSGCGGASSGTENGYSIGVIKFSGTDQTSTLLMKGYESKAKELGYEVTSIDPQGETDKAVAAMQTLVQKDVDMILVTVFPSSQLIAGLAAAKNAGIPVISLGGGPADGVQAAWTSDRL